MKRGSAGWWRAASLLLAAVSPPCDAKVEITELSPPEKWTAATEPGALRRACSAEPTELPEFFAREGLPFRPDLVQRTGGKACHVLYRPSLSGFRAAPDDDPLSGILFDSDPLLYLAASPHNHGDPLGAMKEVLRLTTRPLEARILMPLAHDEAAYAGATLRNFPGTPHRVTLVDRGVERAFWWLQDALKSGASARGATILVPHSLFEGRPENAEAFDPMLARLAARDRAVRSRLSWEGGDLLVTRDPRDARRLLLVHGNSAKPYWGESLTEAEFEYVLGLEFGADGVIDLSGIAPHVDYVVLLLPREKTALVSVPVSGDLAVARAAAEALAAQFGDRPPAPLEELRRCLSSPEPDRREIARLLARSRREQGDWAFRVDPALPERMKALVARLCPGAEDCFSATHRARLVEADPDLFDTWVHAVQRARDEQTIIGAHLDLVESQIEGVPEDHRRRTMEAVSRLETAGFRVIRVPAFRVDLTSARAWPGISYVNGLVVDSKVFVPRFGLGQVEDRIFQGVGAQLPAGYSIVPIDAQSVLVRNGGLHCLAGLVR